MILSFAQLHDEVTRLVDAIRNGGGGGGSTVTVTQKRTTGDNIAAITVNGNTTELYAPKDAKDIVFDNEKEGVFSNDNVQDVLDEVGYTLADHDARITQNASDISDLNDTLSNLSIKGYTAKKEMPVTVTLDPLSIYAMFTRESQAGYKFLAFYVTSNSAIFEHVITDASQIVKSISGRNITISMSATGSINFSVLKLNF